MVVHLIGNPAAGRGGALDVFRAAYQHLAGRARTDGHLPASADDARLLLDELVAEGVERVVVVGGDGMVHLAADRLAGTDTVLGIVAGGTGNDASAGLGLPGKLADQCEAALGASTAVDLIECDGRHALTVAIVGLAVAINERAEDMRFPRGASRYTVATLAELPRLGSHDLRVTLDGGDEQDMATNLLAVANLPYFGGGMKIAPDADPTDGLLDLISIGPAGPVTIGALLPTVFKGRHVRNDRVTVTRAAEISINGPALRMRADGEAWGELPVTLRVAAGALHVAGASPG